MLLRCQSGFVRSASSYSPSPLLPPGVCCVLFAACPPRMTQRCLGCRCLVHAPLRGLPAARSCIVHWLPLPLGSGRVRWHRICGLPAAAVASFGSGFPPVAFDCGASNAARRRRSCPSPQGKDVERKVVFGAISACFAACPPSERGEYAPDTLFLLIEYGKRGFFRRQKNRISVYRYRYNNIYI